MNSTRTPHTRTPRARPPPLPTHAPSPTCCLPPASPAPMSLPRSLVPQVRSTTLDTWLPEQVATMARLGNRRVGGWVAGLGWAGLGRVWAGLGVGCLGAGVGVGVGVDRVGAVGMVPPQALRPALSACYC